MIRLSPALQKLATLQRCVLLLLCLMGLAAPALADITASSASDVCSPTADPCVVTTNVNIVDGSTLDFGTRGLTLQTSGRLTIGAGSSTVLCGDLTLQSWSYPRIVVRDTVGQGYDGGHGIIISRGSCSGDSSVPCLYDDDCQVVSAGSCSAGTGNMIINADILGWADPAGTIELTAHGNVTSTHTITMSNGNYDDADGGVIRINTTSGSITTGDLVTVHGGNSAGGGTLWISSATTLTVNAELNAVGGSDSGGSIILHAGGDITLNAPVNAYSGWGSGNGGTVDLRSDNSITIGSSRTVNTSGHRDNSTGINGSGGEQRYAAAGSITVNNNAQLLSSAANTTSAGYGGTIELSGCAVSINSGVAVQANGNTGGTIQIKGGDSVTVNNSSTITVDSSGTNSQTTAVSSTGNVSIGSQAVFTPSATVLQDAGLPACQ